MSPSRKQTLQMISDRRHAGAAARARRACEDRDQRRLCEAEQAHLRQRQGLGPLRDHPDPAGAAQPVGDRGQALRPGREALPRGVLPGGRIPADDADLDGCRDARRRGPRAGVPDQRQGHGQARLARGLRPRGAGGRREPGRGRAGRGRAHRERRRQGAEDPAAGALHRGDAAVGDGRRRQADRRRRAARGDAGEGPGHAGDARGDHRRPDLREVHPPRRPRAGAGRQGVPADDAAARPRRRGPDQARTDRQLGVPARRDGEGPARSARPSCSDDRADGRAHRQEGQGIRPRHDPRRLRDAADAVPELRRRGARELPALRLHRQAGGRR